MYNFQEIYTLLKKNNPKIIKRFKQIKLICLDFDGTLTNNLVIHGFNREIKTEVNIFEVEQVIRSKTDSYAIDLLTKVGLYDKENYQEMNKKMDIVILSKERSPTLKICAEKIKVKQTGSIDNKPLALKQETKIRKLKLKEVLFMGNDVNDIECIKMAGMGIAVGDSIDYVKNAADYVTQHEGGKGAFREIIEIIVRAKGLFNEGDYFF